MAAFTPLVHAVALLVIASALLIVWLEASRQLRALRSDVRREQTLREELRRLLTADTETD